MIEGEEDKMYYNKSTVDIGKEKPDNPTEAFAKFKRICDKIDRATVVRKFDYSDSWILHYLNSDPDLPCVYALQIPTGERQYVKMKNGMGIQTDKRGIPYVVVGETIGISTSGMQAGGYDLLGGLNDNPTMFMFDENGRTNIVFTSNAMRKTMGTRLPVDETEPSIERDLLLAKKLGEKSPTPLYTVMRTLGEYNLGIGLFACDPKRTSWLEMAHQVERFGAGSCIDYNVTQSKGAMLKYRYDLTDDVIHDVFPQLDDLQPFYIMWTCDSGHVSDCAMAGWKLRGHCESFVVTDKIPVKVGDYTSAIQQINKSLIHDAEVFIAGGDQPLSQDEHAKMIAAAYEESGINLKTKYRKLFLRYLGEQWYDGITVLETRLSLLKALNAQGKSMPAASLFAIQFKTGADFMKFTP